MKYILPFVLILFVIEIYAQQRAFNFSFIGNNSSLVNNYVDEFSKDVETKSVFGSGIGFGFERQYKSNMLFEWGFQANRLGYEVNYRSNFWGDLQESTYKYYQDYISIPLKGGFVYGKKIFGFAKFGLIPSLFIGEQVVTTRLGQTNNSDYRLRVATPELNVFGIAEFGGGFLVGRKINIFSSFAYQRSIVVLGFSDSFYNDNSKKLYALSLALGVKYLIVK
jgi:hypothetical protein